jgi:hypothetical protein
MSLRVRFALVIVWVLSLAVVGVIVSAQVPRRDAAPAPVISGGDIGFRPDGWRGKARTGTWVVRINGEWVEAVETPHAAPATTR